MRLIISQVASDVEEGAFAAAVSREARSPQPGVAGLASPISFGSTGSILQLPAVHFRLGVSTLPSRRVHIRRPQLPCVLFARLFNHHNCSQRVERHDRFAAVIDSARG